MQDSDPKHTSRLAKEFFATNGVNWWRTPPESPDANPIGNLWHELKVRESSLMYKIMYNASVMLHHPGASLSLSECVADKQINSLLCVL